MATEPEWYELAGRLTRERNDLRAALVEAELEIDRLRSYDGDDTPFEAVHAQIRDSVLRAAEEKAAHQILAIATQRAAGRDPLGMKAKDAEIARLHAEHDAALKGELLLRQDVLEENGRLRAELETTRERLAQREYDVRAELAAIDAANALRSEKEALVEALRHVDDWFSVWTVGSGEGFDMLVEVRAALRSAPR